LEVALAAMETIDGSIAVNQYRAGKPLDEPFDGYHFVRRGTYRTIYRRSATAATPAAPDLYGIEQRFPRTAGSMVRRQLGAREAHEVQRFEAPRASFPGVAGVRAVKRAPFSAAAGEEHQDAHVDRRSRCADHAPEVEVA
jgi:hypothetical protein